MKHLTLAITAALIAGCILGKDDKKDEPKFNEFSISGVLAGLRQEQDNFAHIHSWYLKIDSLYPGRKDLYSCTANGYLGNADTTDYTNEYIDEMFIVSTQPFTVPSDTAIARNFTHWRLDITCPDSIPVPQ